MADSYREMHEVFRIVVTVNVTEDGMYWKDEIPDTYEGAYLEVEYPLWVLMSDAGGAQHNLRFAPPQAKNKEDETGCVIKFNGYILADVSGGSSIEIEASRTISTVLESATQAHAVHIFNLNVPPELSI